MEIQVAEKPKVQKFQSVRKVLAVPITKSLQKNSDGTATVRGYFTSDNRDEIGDIITRAATERAIPKYRQWGNIRLMHLPEPVGTITRIGVEDGLDWNEVEILVVDEKAIRLLEFGVLKALSVGILIEWEDIDWIEDGGMIINDYMLAEISLVDHPANYDARLKGIQVEQGLRQLAREHGFVELARSMQILLDRELSMENEVTETTPVVEEEIPAEAPAEEIQPEEEVQVEASIDAAEEVVEETEEVPAEEPVAEEVAAPAEEESINPMAALVDEFRSAMSEFTKAVQEVTKAMQTLKTLEVPAEAPQAEEQAENVEPVSEEAPAGDPEPEDKATPVNRSGAVQETDVNVPAEEPTAQPIVEERDLRSALERYIKTKR